MAAPKLNNGEWMALLAAAEQVALPAPLQTYLESAQDKIRTAMVVTLVDPPTPVPEEGDSDR